MLVSMTGFGRGECKNQNLEAVVEVRSVNNRFLDVTLRMPRSLSAYEQQVKELARQFITRGRLSIYVALKSVNPENLGIQLDKETALAYTKLLNDLRQTAGVKDPVRLEHLLQFSDIFIAAEPDEETPESWECTKKALTEAFESLNAMRRDEGVNLAEDMRQRISRLNNFVEEIEILSKEHIPKEYEALKSRLAEILESPQVDSTRLATAIALLADRLDVTEECVRFKSHTGLFLDLVDSEELAGRKLNFLLQEMNREVNTIGSKANCSEISHRAVFMKEEIEKIREQIQNIE